MADELTISMRASLRNGTLVDPGFTPDTIRVDQASALKAADVQIIGFSAHEALTLADVTTRGYAGFTNLDAANWVEIGVEVAATFYPVIRLLAGESGLFPLSPSVTLYAKADTAAVNLNKWIVSR